MGLLLLLLLPYMKLVKNGSLWTGSAPKACFVPVEPVDVMD